MIFSSQQVNALQWIHLLILYIFNIIKTITWRNHSYALTWFYFFSNTSYVNCVLHKNCYAIIKCITATSYRSIYSISITVHFFFFFFPFYTINWTYQITRLISHMPSILWIRCAFFFVCVCAPTASLKAMATHRLEEKMPYRPEDPLTASRRKHFVWLLWLWCQVCLFSFHSERDSWSY